MITSANADMLTRSGQPAAEPADSPDLHVPVCEAVAGSGNLCDPFATVDTGASPEDFAPQAVVGSPAFERDGVGLTVGDGVARLQLRRPATRNALSLPMAKAIAAFLQEAASIPNLKALVIEGSNGFFCSGADLDTMLNATEIERGELRRAIADAVAAITDLPVPTLAAIEGPCIGAGVAIALACDLRFAARGAFFSIPATRLGLVYNEAWITRLRDIVGLSAAARVLYCASSFSVERARSIGLIDDVDESPALLVEEFLEEVRRNDVAALRDTCVVLRGRGALSSRDGQAR